eukprot:SAG11_NODE_9955_length_866_cov_1.508475_2_plen_66_part_00
MEPQPEAKDDPDALFKQMKQNLKGVKGATVSFRENAAGVRSLKGMLRFNLDGARAAVVCARRFCV